MIQSATEDELSDEVNPMAFLDKAGQESATKQSNKMKSSQYHSEDDDEDSQSKTSEDEDSQ